MKTRSMVVPPYADLDEKALMQASLQHTFSFKPAHGWIVTKLLKKPLDIHAQICYFIMRVECPETAGTVRCKLRTPAEEHTKLK